MLAGTQADIVFLLDESLSDGMTPTQEWVSRLVAGVDHDDDGDRRPEDNGDVFSLADRLADQGITDIQYGLVGFGQISSVDDSNRFAHSQLLEPGVPASLFGTPAISPAANGPTTISTSQLNSVFNVNTAQDGGVEDGWDAIEHAIAEYDVRPNSVPIFVLVQNDEARVSLNDTLTRDGVLSALQSKNAILNTMTVGNNFVDVEGERQANWKPLFDMTPYGLHADLRVLGVEADAADGVRDGAHDFYQVDTDLMNNGGVPNPVGTTNSQALQVSYNGSSTGDTGMVGSGKSVLIGKNFSGNIGPTAAGYSAKSVPFEFQELTAPTAFTTPINYSFDFYGSRTQVWADEDGLLRFTSSDISEENADLSYKAVALPGESTPPARPTQATIAVLWDDLAPATAGSLNGEILWEIADIDDNQQDDLVVQWDNFSYADDTGGDQDPITFQAVVYADGRIQLNYEDLDSYSGDSLEGDFDNDDETLFNDTGGIGATVGIWSGSADQITLPADKFVPGPHSVGGTSYRFIFGTDSNEGQITVPFSELDSNDSYVRMAWDTGGAAWDIGVVDEFQPIDSPEANALRDAFVDSLVQQIDEGKPFQADNVLLALNLGGETLDGTNSTNNEGFVADDGTYTLDLGRDGVNDNVGPASSITRNSNAIPDDLNTSPSPVEDVFKTGRTAGDDHVLQLSFNGSNTSFVGTNKSVAISPDALGDPGAANPNRSQFGYVAESLTTAEFDDISATGSAVNFLNSDNSSRELSIPFAFQFYGHDYRNVFVNTNGLLTFDFGNPSNSNNDWTTSAPSRASIAPLWDDLNIGNGSVYWERIDQGMEGERFVIQWEDVFYDNDFNRVNPITFQAVLFTDGRIQFNYQGLGSTAAPSNSNGGSATVGISSGVDNDVHLVIDTLDGTNPVLAGSYIVELFFAEFNVGGSAGGRTFDVLLEGTTVLNDYDIYADFADINTSFPGGIEHDSVQAELDTAIVKRFEIDVTGGSIDIALLQESGSAALLNGLRIIEKVFAGDFDGDGDVDGFDFLLWQRGFGNTNATRMDGDADGDGDVDADDLKIWSAQYGQGAAIDADFNNDNSVDSVDLDIWEQSFGQNTNGDADGDGDTDGFDFLAWQIQFLQETNSLLDIDDLVETLQHLGAEDQLVVSVTTDEVDGDSSLGDLSLREAVILANAATQPTTIVLPAGRYSLTRDGYEAGDASYNDLDITSDITIQGDGAGLTVIENFTGTYTGQVSQMRVFEATGTSASLKIHDVSLTGVSQTTSFQAEGGVVHVADGATFELTDSAIVNNVNTNSAGTGVSSYGGDTTILRSVFTSNSGTVFSAVFAGSQNGYDGSLTVGDSIFALNTAGYAGPNIGISGSSIAITNLGNNLYDNDDYNFFTNNPGTGDHFGTPDYVVSTSEDTFDHTDDAESLSLREAIDLANNAAGQKEVWVPAWDFVLTRDRGSNVYDTDVSYGDLDIKDHLIIRGVSNKTSVSWKAGIVDDIFDLLGDFNNDGQAQQGVSGSDFFVWQQQNGSGSQSSSNWNQYTADADDDGDVDQDDKDIWSLYNGNSLSLFDIVEV